MLPSADKNWHAGLVTSVDIAELVLFSGATWMDIRGGFNYTTRNFMRFYRPIYEYIPLCYFRHDYFE